MSSPWVRRLIILGGTAMCAVCFRKAGEPWYAWPVFWLAYRTWVRASGRPG